MNAQRQRSLQNSYKQVYNPNDKNLIFINNLGSEYEEENIKNNKKINELIDVVKKQLNNLDQAQRSQWAHILELKCVSLHKKSKINELKSSIRKLVLLSNLLKIPYDSTLIEKIIKPLYYEIYGDDIVRLFKKAGYNIDQYQFVSYSEPWYSKVLSFFSND